MPKTLAIECLLKRISSNHKQPEYLENQLHRATAGISGEGKMVKKFREFSYDGNYLPLWNLNMGLGEWAVQIDGLLLTDRCAIVMDSKNVSGEIHYDPLNEEYYRKTIPGGEILTMENPVFQLNKHIHFMRKWFSLHKINLPVTGLIVYTANNCVFHTKPSDALICKTYQMNQYLYQILRDNPLTAVSRPLMDIGKLIAANQVPFKLSPLSEFYKINLRDVKTGVYCNKCSSHGMQRVKKSWICAACGNKDAAADRLAVQEYFSLIDRELTNRKFREFSGIENSDSARRVLAKYDLEITGDRKTRVYRIKNR
ncbi:nuclease-related domain-containing protein [Planococcus halotolerans]|uniref:NERD domain-containing protein n=1 Tax=Planococcus halotolerans TaxID=2233542 RepID=A0A365KXC0_9BACL|nr:nuclease-related domain-containing protein [Planococcus halotolerans]QHJ72203.1 NERD domain-containing protein [Planococcus halotolerans]RAZ77780.1 NERD domain-containing protein [Planococcus halotolerans]